MIEWKRSPVRVGAGARELGMVWQLEHKRTEHAPGQTE